MWYNENVCRMLAVCMIYLSLYKLHIEWKQGKRPYFSMKNVHICILYLIKRWCQTAIMRYVSWSVRQNIWLLVCTWIVILLSQSQLNEFSQCDVILSHWVCRKIGSLPNTKIKSNKTSKSGSNVLGLVHTWTLLKLNLIRLQSHHTKGSDMSPIWFQINKTDSLPNKTLSSFSCVFQRLDTTRIIR